MYRHAPQYVWIEWTWDPEDEGYSDESPVPDTPPEGHDYSGFRAKVLRNPVGRDVRSELTARLELLKSPPGITQEEYFEVIADRVPEWEYELPNSEGDWVAVPAPGEQPGNESAFGLLPIDLRNWLIRRIRTAHVPKATTQPSNSAGSTEPTSPTETYPETAPPPS